MIHLNKDRNYRYIDREKSWLAFNARVLQEAADSRVPLLDRLRFLGIFSNNLDEFFRVRYAAIRRLQMEGKSGKKLLGGISSDELLYEITDTVINQQAESLRILSSIEYKLKKHGVYIINENHVSERQKTFIKEFFLQKVSPALVTIILNNLAEFPLLKDTSGYLAVKLVMKDNDLNNIRYAIIEIPTTINRFIELSPNLARVLSFVLAFAAIALVISFIGKLIQRLLSVILLSTVNRILGSIIALGTLVFILSVILNLVLMLDKNESLISKEIKQESFFFERVEAVVPAVVPYLNKELWEFIPENYREEIDKKSDSIFQNTPKRIDIDSVFQKKHFTV